MAAEIGIPQEFPCGFLLQRSPWKQERAQMPFDHSSAQESQVRLTHPQWQQHGSVTELKLRVLYVFHTQGFAVSPDPAPSTLWGTLQRERFLPPTHGRPLCGVNASFLVPKAKDSRREPGIPSGAVGDTEQLLFSFLGHLARQKKKKKKHFCSHQGRGRRRTKAASCWTRWEML